MELITNLTQQLTADNGQNFKYGYDSQSGKYGYYVAGSGGADTFIPFSSGGLSVYESGRFTTVQSQANVTLATVNKIRILIIKSESGNYISILVKPNDDTPYTETTNIKAANPTLGTSLTGDNSFHYEWDASGTGFTYEAWGE